jgi:hypothetical protein
LVASQTLFSLTRRLWRPRRALTRYQASTSVITRPWTSVRRRSMPLW